VHRLRGRGRRAEPARRHVLAQQILEAWLHNRAAPLIDGIDLPLMDVHADDIMAVGSE
jgi:hypothetical protein